MAARTLSDKFISSLTPSAKRVTYWDAAEPGLGITVQPSGYKSFVVIRRIRGGQPIKYVIKPPYPVTTLALAREKARDVKRDLANGVNTRKQEREKDAERERLKSEEVRISFASVAEAYISRHIIGNDPRRPNLRSAATLERQIRKEILSRAWTRKPVAAVTKLDVLSLISDITAGRKKHIRSGHRFTPAFKAFNHVRAIIKWAMKRDYGVESNVCDRIDIEGEVGPRAPVRDRILNDYEIRLFWKAATEVGYPGGLLLKALFLSACRLREIANCEWTEFSTIEGVDQVAGKVLTIPARRMKAKNGNAVDHVVPITLALERVFAEVPKFAFGGTYVFSMRGGHTSLGGFHELKTRVDSIMRAEFPELERWTIHDLRRTGRSLMSRAGVQPDIAERVLAHRIGGIRQTYDRYEFGAEKRDALERLAALIERILNPIDNVTPLRAAQ